MRNMSEVHRDIDWPDMEQQLQALYSLRVEGVIGEGGFGRAYKVMDCSGADKVVKFDSTPGFNVKSWEPFVAASLSSSVSVSLQYVVCHHVWGVQR